MHGCSARLQVLLTATLLVISKGWMVSRYQLKRKTKILQARISPHISPYLPYISPISPLSSARPRSCRRALALTLSVALALTLTLTLTLSLALTLTLALALILTLSLTLTLTLALALPVPLARDSPR